MTEEVIKIDANTEIKVTRYSNGKLESKASYVNGIKHGVEEWWDGYDEKIWREMWNEGKRHGVYIDWHESGQKMNEEIRINDGRHGMTARWWDNGAKQSEIYYLRSEKYARIDWDDEGNVIESDFPPHPSIINPAVKSKKNHLTSQVSRPAFKPLTR